MRKLIFVPVILIFVIAQGCGSGNSGSSESLTARNFVVVSSSDTFNGISNVGSAMIISGSTGEQIGETAFGGIENDEFGNGGALSLSNGNFVVSTYFDDDMDSSNDSISIALFNGSTGIQIGSSYIENGLVNALSRTSAMALKNGNFVINATIADSEGITDSGLIVLINGSTGAQIGATLSGGSTGALRGANILPLESGDFAVIASLDDVGGVTDSGSVRLINGSTGSQIGATISGGSENDELGSDGVVSFDNGNFAILSPFEDVGGFRDRGSLRLINGSSGEQIGNIFSGDSAIAFFNAQISPLKNGNVIMTSRRELVNGVVNAGSIRLISGSTGAQIGSTISGENDNDELSSSGVVVLENGNFVVASFEADIEGVTNSGSVMLIDGSTGIQIGSTIAGNSVNDRLGRNGITALENGNFVILSIEDDVNGISDAGSIKLIDGDTGLQIGATISGQDEDAFTGVQITSLKGNNFAVISRHDDINGVMNSGSVRLFDGDTGVQIGVTISGDNENDRLGSGGIIALENEKFVISSPNDDENGMVDVGSLRLINGATGAQIGSAVYGDSEDDLLGSSGIKSLGNGDFAVSSAVANIAGVNDAGSIMLFDGDTGVQIGVTITGGNENDRLGDDGLIVLE